MRHTWIPKARSIRDDDEVVYTVAAQGADELIDLGHGGVLAVKHDGTLVSFALFGWYGGEGDDLEHEMIFHGEGAGTVLRECRHIWWGEDGYTHLLNFALVEAALRVLRRWFDGD